MKMLIKIEKKGVIYIAPKCSNVFWYGCLTAMRTSLTQSKLLSCVRYASEMYTPPDIFFGGC